MQLLSRERKKTRAALCSAIKTRRIIEFYYHGGWRTVEPFCLGITLAGDADNESLLCYQLGGFSELLEPYGWKLYRASEMSEMEISSERFSGEREGYDPEAVEMATIFCCVSPGKELACREREPVRKAEPVAMPAMEKPEQIKNLSLTHNELMKRFRLTHPAPIPDFYTNILAVGIG